MTKELKNTRWLITNIEPTRAVTRVRWLRDPLRSPGLKPSSGPSRLARQVHGEASACSFLALWCRSTRQPLRWSVCWSSWREDIWWSPGWISLSWISSYLRYALPSPMPLPAPISSSPSTSPLYFSEALANTYIQHLAEDIGYRIVGTEEMVESVEYVLEVLEKLKADAAKVGSNKQFEIWHQQDDGAHLFEFMGKVSGIWFNSHATFSPQRSLADCQVWFLSWIISRFSVCGRNIFRSPMWSFGYRTHPSQNRQRMLS